jgi:hypothetical protein
VVARHLLSSLASYRFSTVFQALDPTHSHEEWVTAASLYRVIEKRSFNQ